MWLRGGLGDAAMLLTRAPVAWLRPDGAAPDLAGSAWAWPVLGALLGAAAGAVCEAALRLGLSAPLAAAWTLLALVLPTGALHEDGLADAADGIFGGATPERRLAIMRDSRIGSYGALALLLSFALRGTAVLALAQRGGLVLPGLAVAGGLARAAMVLVLLVVPPARRDGLAALLGVPHLVASGVALVLPVLLALLLLPWRIAALAVLAALCAGLGVARLARVRLGGHTGDVLGGAEQVAECLVLTVLATA